MKILFDNVLLDATLSADAASANYPVENLIHQFLYKRYQHLDPSYDTVTITLDAETDINYFFAGYSNAPQVVVRIYSGAAALLSTDTLTSIGTGTKRIKYSQTYAVKTIEIDVYGGVGGYLGGVGAGVIEDFPDPLGDWSEPFEDNTTVTDSATGQSLRNRILPLKRYTWIFKDVERSVANDYKLLYNNYGIGAIIWIDPFEDVDDFLTPLYAKILAPPGTTKNGRRYDQEWSFRELR